MVATLHLGENRFSPPAIESRTMEHEMLDPFLYVCGSCPGGGVPFRGLLCSLSGGPSALLSPCLVVNLNN